MKDLNKLFCVFCVFLCISCKKETKDDFKNSEIKYRYFNLEKIGWKYRDYTQKYDYIYFNSI